MRVEIRKGQVVTLPRVVEVKDAGIDVKIVDTDLSAFIRRAELARDRADQRPERFSVGDKLDARVTSSTARRAASRCRSRRSKWPRRRRRSPSSVPPIPALRSATSSVPR